MTKKKKKGALPQMEFSGHLLVGENGDLTMGLEVYKPIQLCSSKEQILKLHDFLVKSLKPLGPGIIVLFQDRYFRRRFSPPSKHELANSDLALINNHHFRERPYLEHRAYVFITRTCGSCRPPVTAVTALVRRRLVPKEAFDPTVLKEHEHTCLLCADFLKKGGIECRPLERWEYTGTKEKTGLWEQFVQLNSPHAPQETADIENNNGLRVGNKHVAVYTLYDAEQLPVECCPYARYDPYSTEKTTFPIGPGAYFGALINDEHIVNLFIVLVENTGTLKELETRRRRMHSLAGVDRENAVTEETISQFQEEAAKGEHQLARAHINVIAWTTNQSELYALQSRIVTDLARTGATPHLETNGALRIFLAGLPGNAGALPINETFLTFTEQAACFVIPETNDISTASAFGIRLADRFTGQPLLVDISDEPWEKGLIKNRNKFVLGPSGSGKSYFMNLLLRCYHEGHTHILLVDIGGSYKTLCEFVGGRYFAYTEDRPIQLNPFLLGEGERLDTEKKESLKTLLLALWKKSDQVSLRSEYVALSNMLDGYYTWLGENKEVFPCFDSLYEWLVDRHIPRLNREGVREKDFDWVNFLYVLRPYYSGGEYDWLLNAQEQLNLLQESFIVFELDTIKDHPILFPIVTIVIMELFISKMRKLQGLRKVIVLEEAWKAIAKEGMSEYIKYLYKTVRKFFGEAIVVTQDIDDIVGNEVVKNTIINNADCKILMDMGKFLNRFDEIQNLLGLTDHDKAMALSLNKANDPALQYKEVFISLGPNHSRVYRAEVSLEEHLVYTTEERQRVKVNEYSRRHGGLMKGILALAADIRAGVVQLLMAAVFVAVFLLMPNGRASAQIIDIVEEAVKEVLEQADLKIQELQTEVLYLQDAEKTAENSMTGGLLDDITGWVQQQESLYSEYYNELWQVKTAFSTYSKVTTLIERQAQLVRDYQRAISAVRQDPHFSTAEVSHMLNVYGGILEESIRNTGQLALVINAFVTQMDDAGRLRIIDETAAGIDRNYADLQQYTQQNTLLSMQRAKDEQDIQTIKILYGL
jgi:conjugation system TraG family ATPase